MGKTAIVYYSQHHGNAKKVLDAIAGYDKDVEFIDVLERHEIDLPTGKDVFFIATAGNPINHNFNSILAAAKEKHCNDIGRFQCAGFDTFGPFKLVGGLQKGHPTEDELQAAIEFYRNL
mgnify:CR=1 FL=1